MMDLFQLFVFSRLHWSGLLWCFYQLLDSHSDGTHSLQRIYWSVSDVMLNFSKSDEETNSSTSWMAWAHFQQLLYMWLNYFFNPCRIRFYPLDHKTRYNIALTILWEKSSHANSYQNSPSSRSDSSLLLHSSESSLSRPFPPFIHEPITLRSTPHTRLYSSSYRIARDGETMWCNRLSVIWYWKYTAALYL